MYLSTAFRRAACAALLLCLSAIATAASPSAEEVVLAFNKAISERNMDAALATLADGGVQLQLRPAHPGMASNPPLTGDLVKTWQMVGAIVFPTTESYVRDARILAATEQGELATVWTDTTTTTQRKGTPEPMVLNFSEVYLLVKKAGQWKIAVYADNRAPDTITVSSESD